MNLHLDKDSFRVLIGQVSAKTGYRQDVIEKDYSNRSEVISYYNYVPLVEYDTTDVLQRFGEESHHEKINQVYPTLQGTGQRTPFKTGLTRESLMGMKMGLSDHGIS